MAVEAIVSAVVGKLASIVLDAIGEQVRRFNNVLGDVDKLKSNYQAIKAVLEDAEQQLKKGKASVRDCLDKLKDVSYDIDNALEEWSIAILQSELEPKPKKVCYVAPSPSYYFKRGKLLLKIAQEIQAFFFAQEIQALNGRLDVIANERERYGFKVLSSEKPKRDETTSFVNVEEVKGRVEERERIVNMLLNKGRGEEIGSEFHMISIVGVRGIGKTTLAKLAFDKVKPHFEKKIWLCVSDAFDEMKIAKDILKSVIGNANKEDIEKLDKLEDVMQKLKTSIEGKKFLLVLDDVWTEEYGKWDQLKHVLLSNGSQGSKILVTTRKEKVARSMGCKLFEVRELSEEESWSLFSQIAFVGRSNDDCRGLEDIGREIAKKCKGLPLALKILGGVMLCKKGRKEWQRVLEAPAEPALEGLAVPVALVAPDIAENISPLTAEENEFEDILANRSGAPDGTCLSPNTSAVSIFQINGFDIEANRGSARDGSGQNYRKVPLWEWIFVVSNLIVELPSAVFDQLSSPHKPLYALMAMVFSLLALDLCVSDLLYKGVRGGVTFKRPEGKIPWFYYPSPPENPKPFGTFAGLVGLVSTISQCTVTAINYDFARRAANSPIKFSLLPIIFALGLLCSIILETVEKKPSESSDP